MGKMSKASRLTERPKPPSWEDIIEDIGRINGEDDVVFSVGQDFLPSLLPRNPATALLAERSLNSTSSSVTSNTSDLDVSQIDYDKVSASNNDVLNLVSLYCGLKNAPSNLEEQYTHLKGIGEEMTKTIADLRSQAQSLCICSPQPNDKRDESAGASESRRDAVSKGKSKQKKRK